MLQSTSPYYPLVQSTTSVLPSTTPALLCTTPVLLCTTKYYSSATLSYKVLLQCYSVLQSPTPALLCIQSTTSVLLCTTKYYSVLHSNTHDWSSSHMKRYLQCAEQQRLSSNITKYCACQTKWLSRLIRITIYETLFTMRGATKVTLQHQQILRLPRKMTLMIDPRHIWNVIYNARSNKGYPPTSANIAPATQHDSHNWSASHMKRYLQCAEQQRLSTNISKYCACHIKWLSWLIRVTYETLFTMRGATEVTLQHHQIARLPHKMALMIDPRHIWNMIYNARSNKGNPPTSANIAPATQSDTHD